MRTTFHPVYMWVLAACLLVGISVDTDGMSRSSPADISDKSIHVTVPFPKRLDFALTGSEFLRVTEKMSPARREQAILAEILSGNVPNHIRKMIPVKIGHENQFATVFVLPDYLAIGSEEDYVTIPMTPRTAMVIASEFGFTLPTKKIVDEIFSQSTVRLIPEPLIPGPNMASNEYFREHDSRIKRQISRLHTFKGLIAGHKKDVVLTPRLSMMPERVAIYGWHRQDGSPIQPLSLAHDSEYVDYSHGVRLVSRNALINDVEVDLSKVLSDSELSKLVSDEGRINAHEYL